MAPEAASKSPSHFQLAFALAIAKSKPVGTTIREYITRIRQHLIEGNPAHDHGSHEKYLSAAGHWHSMYQEAQREIDHLQTRVSLLEREKTRLGAQLRASRVEAAVKQEEIARDLSPPRPGTAQPRPSTAQPKSGASKKRKAPLLDDTRVQHKKLKSGENEFEGGTVDAPIVVVDEMARFEDQGLEPNITRHLLSIHKLYHVHAPDCSALGYHLIEATKGITEHITTKALDIQNQLRKASLAKDKITRTQRTRGVLAVLNRDFRKSERAAARAFISLFHGLYTLWKKSIESGKRNHGAVTYEMICSVELLLKTIERCCETHAKMGTDEEMLFASKANGVELSTKGKVRRVDRAPVPQELTTLLLAILSGLTPGEKGPHSAFFEGCLYLIIERVAKKLCLITFKHEPCATVEEEIALDNMQEGGLHGNAVQAINLEVQFLVQLTERAIKLSPGFLGSSSTQAADSKSKATRPGNTTRTTTSKAGVTSSSSSLSVLAKQRLQHTLVQCMFGKFPKLVDAEDSDTEDEEDASKDALVEALMRPVPMKAPVALPPSVEEIGNNIPEWFREEIWRLIGWEILGRDDGW